MKIEDIKNRLKDYFNLSSYLEDESVAVDSIMEGVSFHGPNIVILIIAIFIASLGLNTNSAAVIIGAMLISPLMGPIIGIGLGVGTYNFPLVKRAVRNLSAAAAFSVLASTIYFVISPVSEGHSELLARTSPTIYDVLIGFFGGAAGIVAIACKQKGNVIPGVAIATALMPPLCTAGYGLATWQLQYFTGAFYLFIINSIFISLATLIGVKLFHFSPYKFVDENRRKRVKRWLLTIVIITLLPSIYLTIMMLRESYFQSDANSFIEKEFNFPNTQVFSKDVYIKDWKKYIDITLIGEKVNVDSLQLAMTKKMQDSRMLNGTHINIRQGFSVDSYAQMSQKQDLGDVFTTAVTQIERQRSSIDSLRSVIVRRENFDSLSYVIAPELNVLFPQIKYIALNRSIMCNTDTRRIDTVNVALIEYDKSIKDEAMVKKYIETRTGLNNLHIIRTAIPMPTDSTKIPPKK